MPAVSATRQELSGSGRVEKVVEFDTLSLPSEEQGDRWQGLGFCTIVKNPITVTPLQGLNVDTD